MKKIIFSIILFCISAGVCYSQKPKAPAKPIVSEQIPAQTLEEIPDADWTDLIVAVQSENWQQSALLASGYLTKIKVENSKKQIARLRYILLYSLAGKVVEASLEGKTPEENAARIKLEKTANDFLGKEFFMPSRELSDDCQGKVDYICRSTQQENVLRLTATNKEATAILSFEYVRLKEDFNLKKNIGNQAILSGILNKVEFNPLKSNVWIMRLFFENGAVNVVPTS